MILKLVLLVVIVFLVNSLLPTIYNKRINRNSIKRVKGKGRIALTFDDGPDSRYIYKMLDVLDENGISATFFMVAQNAEKNSEAVKEVLKRGHRIGIHSWQHKNALLHSYSYTKKDFENSVRIMKSLGVDTVIYRPPWGHINIFTKHFAKKYGLKLIYWTVMAEDWSARSTPQTIYEKLLRRVKDNSIICLHDAGENSGGAKGAPENTIAALKMALPELKKKYEFTTEF